MSFLCKEGEGKGRNKWDVSFLTLDSVRRGSCPSYEVFRKLMTLLPHELWMFYKTSQHTSPLAYCCFSVNRGRIRIEIRVI